jgi:hypothetical protein
MRLYDTYGNLSERELDLYFEGLVSGQKITATNIMNQLSSADLTGSDVIKKRRINSLKDFLSGCITQTKEEAKIHYKDII